MFEQMTSNAQHAVSQGQLTQSVGAWQHIIGLTAAYTALSLIMTCSAVCSSEHVMQYNSFIGVATAFALLTLVLCMQLLDEKQTTVYKRALDVAYNLKLQVGTKRHWRCST